MEVGSKDILNQKEKVKEILEKYRNAGDISIQAKKLAQKICKPGASVYTISEQIEDYIRKKGAKPAFPINMSINTEAAHYSAEILDQRIIPENSIIKIDLGAEIDGYLVDTAITINFNPELNDLSTISETALENAIKSVKSGVKVYTIGKIIEKTITDAGYQPIRNLSGHQIKRYELHAGITIPNCGPKYFGDNSEKFQAGKIYAIEPFASNGKGWIKNGKTTNIFRIINKPNKKQKDLIPIYNEFKNKVGVLPFSPRHLHEKNSGLKGKKLITENIRKLKNANIITGYPVLIEQKENSMVSQHEHTVRVTNEGCEVLTSTNL
ncbi:MAG: type II methionyl aminopeptidase [Candidatus Heimdallarchaeota archaeon]|nr:type II methionyl aminopeptidase [Candidatus Heimdallarchaeota archaeon]MDH5645496.1 type II methionyl aminopeptidase [Candidatus Heimdallarchaeota archaeon]